MAHDSAHENRLPPLTPGRSISSATRPSTPNGRAIAVLLKPLIDLHGEPRNWATSAPLYLDALKDIPPELLAVAVRYAVMSNPYFPKPAELRASIVDELTEYRRKRDEARRPKLAAPDPSPPPTAEDIEAVAAALAPVKAMLKAKAAAMRGDKPEFRPTAEQMEASRKELGIDT